MKAAVCIYLFFFSIKVFASEKIIAIAKVATNGAMVYSEANFDAPVSFYLKIGTKVGIVSNSMGPFLKIKFKSGSGYISDIDLKVIKATKAFKGITGKLDDEKISEPTLSMMGEEDNIFIDMDPTGEEKQEPLSHRKYLGLEFRQVEFREQTAGHFRKDDLSGFSLKATGKNLLVSDLPMEVNMFYAGETPRYYESITGEERGPGHLILLDSLFINTIGGDEDRLLYTGFGPMLRYSKFSVDAKSRTYEMSNLNAGVAFAFGFGLRFGSMQIRGDYRYYFEKKQHNGFGISLLKEY